MSLRPVFEGGVVSRMLLWPASTDHTDTQNLWAGLVVTKVELAQGLTVNEGGFGFTHPHDRLGSVG